VPGVLERVVKLREQNSLFGTPANGTTFRLLGPKKGRFARGVDREEGSETIDSACRLVAFALARVLVKCLYGGFEPISNLGSEP